MRAATRPRLLLICVFLLSLPAITPRLYSSDEVQYFSYLRSLWFDHDLSFENEYQHFYDAGVARERRISRDLPRTDDEHRTPHQFRDAGVRDPVGAVLCGR